MIADCIGVISLAIWVYLVFARGGFWKMNFADVPDRPDALPGKVAAIVPARDEAKTVGVAVASLLRQEHAGELRVFLVDDHSQDGTVEAARQAAHGMGRDEALEVVHANPVPSGWTGKVWAMSEGLRVAQSYRSDFYWFTDADIVHEPENLSRLMARAESGGFDLVSQMVKLRCQSVAEKLLVPAFVFFFFKLYPPKWVNRPEKRTAAAAGGNMLMRRTALERSGGISVIRAELIDDCALARAVKRSGRIWLEPTKDAASLREYGGFAEIGHMIARSAFTQLNHSVLLLLAAVLGMTLTYLAPVLILGCGPLPALLGATALVLMLFAYRPILSFYGLSCLWSLTLPLTAAFYVGSTVVSAAQYWSGRGGSWKGRVQDVRPGARPS